MLDIDLFKRCLTTTACGVLLFMLADEVVVDPSDKFWRSPSGNGNGRTIWDEMSGLAEDLQRLQDGWRPTADDLFGCPRIEDWGVTFLEDEDLWRVVGSPSDISRDLPDVVAGEMFCTMQVLAVDHEFSWVRDRRGFYILGELKSS